MMSLNLFERFQHFSNYRIRPTEYFPESGLDGVENVLFTDASMSLLANVSKHCGSDELLYDLRMPGGAIFVSD